MVLVPLLSFVAASVSGLVVGIRLVRAGLRTHEVPELSIGLSSLATSVGALCLALAMRGGPAAPLDGGLFAAAHGILALSVPLLAIGTWRIFRPRSRVAAAMCVFIATQVALTWLWMLAGDPLERSVQLPGALLQLGRGAAYGWAAAECFRHYARMRRRQAIGLADPLIAHQFWLWGVSAALLTAVYALGAYANGVHGIRLVEWPAGLLLAACLAMLGSVGIWLAFFPPKLYRRRVQAQAPL